MRKKAVFIALMLFAMVFATSSVSAACSIYRYKSDVKNVKVNSSLGGDDVPIVIIGWSNDHKSDLSFLVTLQNAEWNYGKTGTIQTGVTYEKQNDTTIEVFCDVGTGEGEINFGGGRNIHLPIDCTTTHAGEVRVIVDGGESTVSSANVLIAKVIDGKMTVHGNKAAIYQSGTLKKITFTDTSSQSYKQGQKITMELSGGFHFTGISDITGTGKFKDKVKFEVDANNSSKAYVTMLADTEEMNGEVILENTGVTRNSTSKFSVVLMHATFSAGMVPLDSNLPVISYDKDAAGVTTTTTTEATTETTTEASTETTTQSTDVVIQIGASSYTVGDESYTLDSPAYISGGSTMLPLRALANAIGIDNTSIDYDSATKTVTIKPEPYVSISITAGEDKLMYSANGSEVLADIDAPAQIVSGRLFLPLRATAKALGIEDSAISYDAQSKTVTIKR